MPLSENAGIPASKRREKRGNKRNKKRDTAACLGGLGTEVENLQSQVVDKERRKRKRQREENGKERVKRERRNKDPGLGKRDGVR